VTPIGVVTTLAGSAGIYESTDGTGSAARFHSPAGVAVDSSGNVYVADQANSTIRKVTPGGVVTTLAGLAGSQGSADGTASAARFNLPYGVAVDGNGNVYVADVYNSNIRMVVPGGVVTTLAGLAGSIGNSDGIGSASRFYYPYGVAVDGSGNVYVGDTNNNRVSKGVPAVTPGLVQQTSNTDGYMTLTLTKRTGETYVVQSAGTLAPGQPTSFSAATTTVLIDNPTTLQVMDNFPAGTVPQRFLRVQVTATP